LFFQVAPAVAGLNLLQCISSLDDGNSARIEYSKGGIESCYGKGKQESEAACAKFFPAIS
jgi:hypothetical protein